MSTTGRPTNCVIDAAKLLHRQLLGFQMHHAVRVIVIFVAPPAPPLTVIPLCWLPLT